MKGYPEWRRRLAEVRAIREEAKVAMERAKDSATAGERTRMQSKLDALEARISALETESADYEKRIAALESKSSNNEVRIIALEVTINGL